MKILVLDPDRCGLPFSLLCKASGHDVILWMPPEQGTNNPSPIGNGLVDKVRDWEGKMKWADLIVVTDNSKYSARLETYFQKDFPIVGANQRSAALELDREVGSKFLNDCGIKTLPFQTFTSFDDAISHVRTTGGTFVCKPWGGTQDKALSYVSKSPADMIFTLERWRRSKKLQGKFMLQKKVSGVEMGVAGWFGPGGWCSYIDENWEHKKLMNDDLGCNTGEMGTVMRYVTKSKLFNDVLAPCTERLHRLGYVGNVDVNCIVAEDGTPWPLEFTMRFGWPSFNLCTSLHLGDPAEWLGGLLEGKDLLRCKEDVCVGVVLAHGDFPYSNYPAEEVVGFPITGLTAGRRRQVSLSSVMMASAPMMVEGKVKNTPTLCTAGEYVAVVTGHGSTVCEAQASAYDVAWKIDWPSNKMMRTDIGCRLEEGLPLLQAHGYAKGMRYE